ncbi:hypothetical protein DICVIV_09591 [Dictyocaulus viviparus]|uniref:PLAT domain-containing protein n=1 Tax=Dictyocaulus viviparus TaxID=29172 RepID=A0A0D8XIA1_DICVI|nr:hypothetical protein DICVIV_09591 [Dictyocaulus viviparus]
MEGLSTKNKKHTFTSETDDWVLKMSVEKASDVIPNVALCSGHQAFPMTYQPNESGDKLYTYEMKGNSIGNLQKLRVGMGELGPSEHFYIKKMRLENRSTKTMLRFPSVDTEFQRNQVYEFSPVYPDIQPTLNILYTISLTTIESSGLFSTVINIIGEDGDSGMRKFNDDVPFVEGTNHNFDIDAVNLGVLKELDLLIEGDENSSWLVRIVVGMADSNVKYITDLANLPKPGQLVQLPLRQQ